MNDARRKALAKLSDRIQALQPEIETIRDELAELAAEEREAFDALPESIQDGERGQAMDAAADSIEEASSCLDNFNVDKVVAQIEEATS